MRKHIYRRNRLTESKIRGRRLTEGTRNFGVIHSGDMPSLTYACFDWFADDMYDECYDAFVKGKSYSELGKLEDKYGSIQESPEYERFEEDFTTEYMSNIDVDRILFEYTQRDIEEMVDEANGDIFDEFEDWADKNWAEGFDQFQYFDFAPYTRRDVYVTAPSYGTRFSPIVIEYGYYGGAKLTALGKEIDEIDDYHASAELSRIVKEHLNAIISELA